jgi:DNA-binding NtrC family response regulator
MQQVAMGALRILVVDDESLMRWAVTETLIEAGHDVVQATDAATALQAVGGTSKPFDLVLLDFRLPDSDDLSLLHRIRRLAPATAVVMMTAHGTTELTNDAKQLGAYDVIAKPFDVVSIPQVLVHACRSKMH